MMLISNFHDYYDTALGFGVDKDCVYNRSQKQLNLSRKEDKEIDNSWFEKSNNKYKFNFYEFIIGFCGEIYPMIIVEKRSNFGNLCEVDYLYSFQEYSDYIKNNEIKFKYFWFRRLSNPNEYFNKENWKFLKELFRKYHVPCFLIKYRFYKEERLILNPKLKDYRFMKIKDPYTAFQEIHMYLSGVLGNKEKETTSISDKDKIKQKGFDKWSFRKPPKDKK